MKKFFTFIISILIAVHSLSQGSWKQLSNFPGGPRYGAVSLVVDNKVYVGLGAKLNGTPLVYSDWWEYDFATDTWTRKADFPVPIYFASGVVINENCYVGLGVTVNSYLENIWYKYDAQDDKWNQKSSFPKTTRYGASTFVIDSIGYFCCGNEGDADGPFTNTLWSYNPRTDKWKEKAALPAKSHYFGVGFSINGKGYVEGGVTKNDKDMGYKYFRDLRQYDPVFDSWSKKITYPDNGASQACFVVNDKAYVGLGVVQKKNFNNVFYSYDPSAKTWQDSIAEFPADGREGACSFSINGKGYVMLGYNFDQEGYYNDVWEYTPSASPRISLQNQINNKPFVEYALIGNKLIPSFNPSETASTFYFKLYDLSGRLIQSQTINNSSMIYLDADLPKGIYLIVTSDGRFNSMQEILIN